VWLLFEVEKVDASVGNAILETASGFVADDVVARTAARLVHVAPELLHYASFPSRLPSL